MTLGQIVVGYGQQPLLELTERMNVGVAEKTGYDNTFRPEPVKRIDGTGRTATVKEYAGRLLVGGRCHRLVPSEKDRKEPLG
jgi:hypothetical protein